MEELKNFHFIGIGGVGMSGLARLLLQQDVIVSGSDLSANYITEKLTKEGAEIMIGHAAKNIHGKTTVVYTTGVDAGNPEYAEAMKYKCSLMHRSDLLRTMMMGHRALAVAGTHGKTTTSALLASVLAHAGLDPTFAIGGTLPQFQSNAVKGNGLYFVAEACESDGTFVKYHPYGAIVTNIDCDHMDFFGSEQRLINAFTQFIGQVSQPQHLFWCYDDARLRNLSRPGYSYGYGEGADLKIENARQEKWDLVFDITFKEEVYKNITLPLIGRHNVLNAAAVFGLCLTLDVDERAIRQGFAGFKGVNRRCEKKGSCRDVLVIDDYAHHPTEIATTLNGIRKAIGDRRMVVVFQPHRYTRTKDCLGLFHHAFNAADEVIVTDVYAAGEQPIEGITGQSVAQEIAANFRLKAHYLPRHELLGSVAVNARPHDVIVTLGAGDITKLGQELLQRWDAEPPRKWSVSVVFGGKSLEHEVSHMSAKHVVDSLDTELYDVNVFCIDKNGKWGNVTAGSENCADKDVEPISSHVLESLMKAEVFFPVLHGPYGEDGTIQGFFDTLGKAYVGCDHRSAAICMDKAFTKKIVALSGIPIVPFISFSDAEWCDEAEMLTQRISQELRFPVFVKPLHLGSTAGVSKVESKEGLQGAIENAFKVDTQLLVENGLNVREIEFAVLGNDTAVTFPPGEILTGGKVYDYHGKYDSKDPIKAVPNALLSQEIIDLGMEWAKKAYKAAECKGMARVDFFLDSEGQLWLNEINPIPGFTKNSLYPQICAHNGMDGKMLASELIVLALQRKRHLQRSLENLS